MLIIKTDNEYSLQGMTIDDLKSLHSMIKGAGLLDRRHWEHIKNDIKNITEQ